MSCPQLLVIPSEVEESLTLYRAVIRDVSTSLDMTMDGQTNLIFLFSGRRGHRVSLFIGRPRGRVGYIAVMALLGSCDDHPADGIVLNILVAPSLFSILESRTFFLEIILAFRAAFRTGGLFRRLSAIARGES